VIGFSLEMVKFGGHDYPDYGWVLIIGVGFLIGFLCLFFALRNGRKKRFIENIPTSKTTGVFIGFVEIKGTAEITIPGGNGVQILQEALIAGRDNVKEKNTDIKIYTEGSPRYSIEVTSEDYKLAEKALENALNRIEEVVESNHGAFSFNRKK